MRADAEAVSAESVNTAADQALAEVQDVLVQLWDDCPEPVKDAYRDLIEFKFRPASDISRDQRAHLVACGFATENGAKFLKSCRLLEKFVRERRADHGSVARLFRSADGYRANIRSIIELRLAQLMTIDVELKRAITKSIEDVPESPPQILGNMRNIAERSFTLIWSAEFGENRNIPSHLFSYWRDRGVRRIELFERLQIPGELRPQCRLLQLLVGAEQEISRQAKHISQQTYHLLNAVVGYGNYGQHTQ